MARVLLIEDDAAVGLAVTTVLEALGPTVDAAPSAELGRQRAAAEPAALVLLDIHLPGRSGLEALPELLALDPPPPVVVMTANPTAENAIEAMALGAAAHLAKPLDDTELAALVERLVGVAGRRPHEAADAPPPRLVGSSPAMLDLGRRVGAIARSDATVLIRGESGTGKELVARAIHERSNRREGPFVAVSCAALPEALLEAELFGHAKGAYTGADRARPGRVERASGGTLFLDEVGELTAPAQAKLLRFLEERTFERVGETEPRRADVRVLAATNAPLEERVEEGAFRDDLYYRLDVVRVELPPLRARRQDLPALVEHFLARLGRPDVTLTPEALEELEARPWPGNVRELRNAVESAVLALGPSERALRPEHLPSAASTREAAAEPRSWERFDQALAGLVQEAAAVGEASALWDETRARLEKALVSAALAATHGNQVAAARLLGMNRATLRRKMADHGLG